MGGPQSEIACGKKTAQGWSSSEPLAHVVHLGLLGDAGGGTLCGGHGLSWEVPWQQQRQSRAPVLSRASLHAHSGQAGLASVGRTCLQLPVLGGPLTWFWFGLRATGALSHLRDGLGALTTRRPPSPQQSLPPGALPMRPAGTWPQSRGGRHALGCSRGSVDMNAP